MNKPKLWTKDFLLVFFTNFFIGFTFYLLMVVFSEYAINNFDASQSQAGLASSIFVIGALLVRPFAGKYIAILGRKKMLYSGLLFSLLTSFFYLQADSLLILYINRLIHGVAFGIAATAIATIVTDIVPKERRGEGIGYFAMSMNIATAIGPFVALFIIQYGSFEMIFFICILFALLALVASLFFKIPTIPPLTDEQLGAMKGFKLKNFFEPSSLPISLFICVLGFSYSSVISFMSAYAKEINLVDAASFFFIVYACTLLASRPFTGRWFDTKGENFVLYPTIILFGIGLLTLSQSHHGISFLLAGALMGIGYGTIQSSSQAIAVKEAPPHRVGLATSTFYVMLDGGFGIGPFLLGFIIPITGYRGLYASLAMLSFASIFIYYLAHGKKAAYRKKLNHAA